MAVEFINMGVHKNVYAVVFGHNDVMITQACQPKTGKACLMFHTNDPETLGNPDKYAGANSDNMPCPEVVLMFEDPETIATLIQSLCEIQKLYFK